MMKCIQTLTVFAAVFVVGVAADDDHPYYCTSDAYCEKNTQARSASPSTTTATSFPNSADRGYLNAHCVFVSEENLSLSSSGSGSSRRRLKSAASSSGSTSTASSSGSAASASSISSSTESSSAVSTSSSASSSGSDADTMYTATIDGEEVTGQYVCLDVSDCENKAADPSTCYPSACGSSDSKEQYTYQGTCTYKSKSKIKKRTCMCYAGFEGDMCSTEVSGACDVDCGTGGDCVDGECVCKEGFDGKAYDGKQGAANERCTRCTNDLACQYNNTCNTDTGKCVCAAGYSGDTCGATEDSCTTRTDCGIGSCQVLSNGSSACYCPSCSPSCTLCDMNANYTFDCSTCADGATTTQASKLLTFVSMFVAIMLVSVAL